MPKIRQRRSAAAAARLEARLEEIKTTATKYFFQHGYDGTDLRMISRDLDMHAGSLYNYISSKQELLYLILKDGMQEISLGLDEALQGLERPLERLRQAILFHFMHHANRRQVAWTNHIEVRSLTAPYRDEIVTMRKVYEEKWVGLINDCLVAHEIRTVDGHLVALGILSMAQGFARWFRPDGRLTAQDVADCYADLIINGLSNHA